MDGWAPGSETNSRRRAGAWEKILTGMNLFPRLFRRAHPHRPGYPKRRWSFPLAQVPGHDQPPNFVLPRGPGHDQPPNFILPRGPGHDHTPNFIPLRGPGHDPESKSAARGGSRQARATTKRRRSLRPVARATTKRRFSLRPVARATSRFVRFVHFVQMGRRPARPPGICLVAIWGKNSFRTGLGSSTDSARNCIDAIGCNCERFAGGTFHLRRTDHVPRRASWHIEALDHVPPRASKAHHLPSLMAGPGLHLLSSQPRAAWFRRWSSARARGCNRIVLAK